MNILVVTTGLGYGGAERMLLNLTREWTAAGHDVHIVVLADDVALSSEFEACGAQVQPFKLKRGLSAFLGLPAIVRAIRIKKPDIVQTWMPHADLLGGIAARLAGVKELFWGLHHADLSRKGLKFSTALIVRCNALLSGILPKTIVAVSEHVRLRHVKSGFKASRIEVIPNAIDVEKFQFSQSGKDSVRAELGISDSDFVVGFLGRFDRVKRLEDFLDVAKVLAATFAHAKFVMAGDRVAPGNQQLEAMIAVRKLGERISLLGNRDDVAALLSAFDVVLCTSQDEAFGMVILEALACATPCVSTRNQGCLYAGGEFAAFVDVGDVDGFVQAVVNLSKTGPEATAEWAAGARAYVASKFGIRSAASQYINLYLCSRSDTDR